MSESYKDGKKRHEPKCLINKPIDFATSQLSKNVKAMRYSTDEEGNVWAMPVVPYKYDSTTDRVIPAPSFSRTELIDILGFQHQANATLAQAAAVQNTWYTVLNNVTNARILGACVVIGTTGETLECRITADGIVIPTLAGVACVAGTNYYLFLLTDNVNSYTGLSATTPQAERSFLIEGKILKVEVRKTTVAGAGTLTASVMYQRRV